MYEILDFPSDGEDWMETHCPDMYLIFSETINIPRSSPVNE
jgi:hypothetical protein|tara:strand:- start:600 stop:722 length:123 start_codon:yes stop_codon:yes gene_type:complete